MTTVGCRATDRVSLAWPTSLPTGCRRGSRPRFPRPCRSTSWSSLGATAIDVTSFWVRDRSYDRTVPASYRLAPSALPTATRPAVSRISASDPLSDPATAGKVSEAVDPCRRSRSSQPIVQANGQRVAVRGHVEAARPAPSRSQRHRSFERALSSHALPASSRPQRGEVFRFARLPHSDEPVPSWRKLTSATAISRASPIHGDGVRAPRTLGVEPSPVHLRMKQSTSPRARPARADPASP